MAGGAQQLNPQSKTGPFSPESMPAQNGEAAPAAPRKRVRRTERYKDLYDSNDPNA